MRVLVGCEESQAVCKAFRAFGHEAYSCDLIPCSGGNPEWHIIQDVLEVIKGGTFKTEAGTWVTISWDLGIYHPPCTYLSSSGLHWNKRIEGREEKTQEALAFIRALMESPFPWAIENPIGAASRIRKPDQIIQPWQFGHPESKSTCLWLKGLPKLEYTNVLTPTKFRPNGNPLWDNQTPSGQNKLGPSDDRAAIRSKTYPGIAEAFAEQWNILP